MGFLQRTRSVGHFTVRGIAICALFAAVFYLLTYLPAPVERQHGPLPHDIYVWQRHWDQALSQAIDRTSDKASGFSILAAEVSWKANKVDRVVCTPIDYEALETVEKPIGLALRIGPYSGPFDESDSTTTLLVDLAASLVEDARSAGVEPTELQIDFDCAESDLRGYSKWIGAFQEKIAPVPVTITVLPCWLKKRTFPRLARTAGSFVLQVHSLERPESPDNPITLCDSEAAVNWVEQAAHTGVPFRVALPTYGYLIAFDNKGDFIGLSAEGPSRAWPADATLSVVRSDPTAMAGLLRGWEHNRPANMQGVIWYRLPVESDRLNWRWQTLSAIMQGRSPNKTLQVKVEYTEPELAEIVLVNNGEIDLPAKVHIELDCEAESLIAADGLCGFVLAEQVPLQMCLSHSDSTVCPVIRAGEEWKVAWLRFSKKTEVRPHVTMPQI